MKKAEEIVAKDVAQLYAAAFIVLKRNGQDLDWPSLASDIQDLWNDVANSGSDIIAMCEAETGYEFRQGCIMEDIE